MGRPPTHSPWMRAVSVITLLAMTGCSVIREMPPAALTASGHKPASSSADTSRAPGRWLVLRGYEDSHGKYHHASGRVRAIPGDSLELNLDGSLRSVTRSTNRSVIPSDSVSFLQLERTDNVGTLLVMGVVVGAVVLFVVALREALTHFPFGPATFRL